MKGKKYLRYVYSSFSSMPHVSSSIGKERFRFTIVSISGGAAETSGCNEAIVLHHRLNHTVASFLLVLTYPRPPT